jgi:dienelactone hydrolase
MTTTAARGADTVPGTGAVPAAGPVVGPLVTELSNGSWGPSLSPDGSRAVFVSDRDGTPRAWLGDARAAQRSEPRGQASRTAWHSGPDVVPLPTGPDPVTAVHFSPDGEWIACEIAPGGAPRTELWLIRPDGTGLRQVAGFGATTILSAGWLEVAGSVVFGVTEIGEVWRAILINPRTCGRRRIAAGELVALLDVSRDGRFAVLREGPRGRRHATLLDLASGATRPLLAGAGEGSTERARFAPDGSVVYARTDVDGELARLVVVPVGAGGAGGARGAGGAGGARGAGGAGGARGAGGADGGVPVTVVWRGDAELEDFAVTADGGSIALLWNRYGRSELVLRDTLTGVDRQVAPPAGEVLSGGSFARDGRTFAMCAEGPGSPRAVWLVEVETAFATALERPGHARPPAVGPELHHLRSGDGIALTGWFYRPAGLGPYPTMISLHPGPEAQERPGHHPIYQQLVARGIAVFAPNVRGSSGFGRTFVNADNLAGRHGAIADVAACVEYLVGAGFAAPGKVGCMGRSYGGYLTLAALVWYPEHFAVGVEVCGMSDLLEFYEHTEPWIRAAAVSKYGHPEHDRELLRELSPLPRIGRLAAPLLVVHGASDTNVPAREAEQLVGELRRLGLPHRYVCLPDEGHDFVREESRRRYLDETVAWVTRHLHA